MLGPRRALTRTLELLQDAGTVHLSDARERRPELGPAEPTPIAARRLRQLRRLQQRVQWALDAIRDVGAPAVEPAPASADAGQLARWARLARQTRRSADAARARVADLEEERDLLLRYRDFFRVFESVLQAADDWTITVAFPVVLRADEAAAEQALRDGLRGLLGEDFELLSRELPSGERALLILAPASGAQRVERLLMQARVQEIPLPASYAGRPAGEAWPAIRKRLEALPGRIAEARRELAAIGEPALGELLLARRVVADRLMEEEAAGLAGTTARAFVLEGWAPLRDVPSLGEMLGREIGGEIALEVVSREEWSADEAPVALSNPRILRPFEVLIALFPLPRYGTIDPTPFVAVFFPMFFGIILGDAGYGVALGLISLVLHRRSGESSTLRSISEVAGAGAVFAVIFGVLFGEVFGDLGRRVVGMRPILFDREEALVPFLGFAVALGLVHVLIGLGLGVITGIRRRELRHALGPGLTALMIVLIVLGLLVAMEKLPASFFSPVIIGLLVTFPVLVVVEGLIAPVELLSTIGHILSYARVMAIGTASVMMAVVANRMVGAFGGVIVGTLFALLFHLVNFALGLFSPTIHALRLHYVEFFGTFYSPGGVPYRPFGHWKPRAGEST